MSRRQLLVTALLVSVAINLFFIGGLGIRMLRLQDMREARPLPPNLGWIVRDLNESRRSELADTIRSSAEQVMPLRRAMFSAQGRVNELMAAEDFDAEALTAAFAELRAASSQYQQVTQEQTVNILAKLTPEERQSAREFVRRRGPRDGPPGPGGPRPPRLEQQGQEPAQ